MLSIDVSGGLYLRQTAGVAITGTTNNVNPGTGTALYVRSLADGSDITGFTGGEAERLLVIAWVRNSRSTDLPHNSGSSTAANRLMLRDLMGGVRAALGCLLLLYDAVDLRWKQIGF